MRERERKREREWEREREGPLGPREKKDVIRLHKGH